MRLGLSLGVALLCATPAVHAQGPTAEEEARKAYADGLAAEPTDPGAACVSFRRALELTRELGPLKKVKECDLREKKVVVGRAKLRELISRWPQKDAELSALEEELRSVEARVARLRLTLKPEAPPGTTIRLDGQPVTPGEAAIEVDPGDHEVLLSGPNGAISRSIVTLADGETKTLALAPEASPAPGPTPTRPPPPDDSFGALGISGFVIGGIGVLGLVGGAVTGGMVLSTQSEFEDCRDRSRPAGCDLGALEDEGDALLAANGVLFIAGGVLAATGLTLVIVDAVADDGAVSENQVQVGLRPMGLTTTVSW